MTSKLRVVSSTHKTFLCIFCDTTASMGTWIAALNKMIPQFIRISALTGAFEKIMIVSYKDYDAPEDQVITSTGWLDPFDQGLIDFAKKMTAAGGGGQPEAVKSGLYHILHQLPPDIVSNGADGDRVYIIHLTDAIAHDVSERLDAEGRKEQAKLGKDAFDWLAVNKAVTTRPICYNILSTSKKYAPYAALASATGGFYIEANMAALEKDFLNIFNGWFHADEGLSFTTNVLTRKTKAKRTDTTESDLIKSNNITTAKMVIAQEQLATALKTVLLRLDVDIKFQDIVFTVLRDIIGNDLLTLSSNKIFGKVWRKICTFRKDPRRDELILLIENLKKKLKDKEKEKFEAWLKESYNMIEEIHGELQDLIDERGGGGGQLMGRIEFMRDLNDNADPFDSVQMLRNLGNADQSYIKNIFARMTIHTDKIFDTSCIDIALPLEISSARLFSLIVHLASPGTKFNGKRHQAILAMLALGTVLDGHAKDFLLQYKGQWLNWSIDETGKPDIPENFQVKFLYLCKANKEYLLPEEYDKIEKLTKLTLCNRIPEMVVTILHENITSMDGVRPDHHLTCLGCQKSRPLSLVLPNGKQCGYCIYNNEPKTVQTPEATFMVRCSKCKSFYSRDRAMYVLGKSQCHECFNNGVSNHVECVQCHLKFVTYNGLPNNTCKPCELKLKPVKATFAEHNVTVRQIFEEQPELIDHLIGFSYKKGVTNLLAMDIELEAVEPLDPVVIKSMEIMHNNKVISNLAEIVDKMVTVIQSHYIQPLTCDLCCEAKPRADLGRACGRAGCELIVCNDCGSQWYGENRVGCLINLRHCQCMFCARAPSNKVINRWWHPAAAALMTNLPPMDTTKYYAWCIRCDKAKVCADRACGAGHVPRVTNFECEQCEETRLEAERVIAEEAARRAAEEQARLQARQLPHPMPAPTQYITMQDLKSLKRCPKCNYPTVRYSGCNHITCPCGCHWCYECGKASPAGEIYNHMRKTHGRMYSYETPLFQEDDGYESF